MHFVATITSHDILRHSMPQGHPPWDPPARRPSASKGEAFPGGGNGSGMGFTWIYPLVMTNIAVENGWTWAFIVDVPIEKMVILKESLVITVMTNSLLWKMESLSRIFPQNMVILTIAYVKLPEGMSLLHEELTVPPGCHGWTVIFKMFWYTFNFIRAFMIMYIDHTHVIRASIKDLLHIFTYTRWIINGVYGQFCSHQHVL